MSKTIISAEAGVNHNGELDLALRLIREAAEAGADVVKFQTYKAEKLVTKSAPRFWDRKEDEGKTQFEAYKELDDFPFEHYATLKAECDKLGIEFTSTPFDMESAKFLADVGMKSCKVASADITYLPYLEYIAGLFDEIVLSTGASTLGEIDDAVRTIRDAGNNNIVLLHCTLKYPTNPEDANLRAITTLKILYPDLRVGLSDHTLGIAVALAAVALGAEWVEKHYTVDKTLPKNADHWLSIDTDELRALVKGAKEVTRAMGSPVKEVKECEQETRMYDKRSITTLCDIKKGEVFTDKNLTCKRPGTGISPKHWDIVIGRESRFDIKEDTTITWKLI